MSLPFSVARLQLDFKYRGDNLLCDNDNTLEPRSQRNLLKHLLALQICSYNPHTPLGHDNHASVSSVFIEQQSGLFKMATNGYTLQNGIANGPNGTSPMNGSRRRRARVLTLDEALPYSPFSSVVPFNSGTFSFSLSPFIPLSKLMLITHLLDTIPLPSIGLRSSTSIYSTSAERETGRQDLESLNREAQDPHNTSERLQKSLNDLKELLKPEGIAQLWVGRARF